MKKLAVLVIALVLAVGMPLLASDFSFGGDLDWGFISNFNDGWTRADYNATFDVKAAVDDFNSVGLSIKHQRDAAGVTAANETILEKAQLSTNLGKAMGLPIGVTSYAGYFDFGSEEYASITGYDLSDIYEKTGTRWQWGVALGIMDVVTIEAATNWDFTGEGDYWLGAHGVFGPVSAELWYENTGTVTSNAIFGLSALVELAVMEGSTLKVGGGYETNLDADTSNLGAAVQFDYNIFGVGVGFSGDDVEAFRLLSLEASVKPLDNVGINVGALLDLPGAEVLNNVDASVYYKAGAATMRVGYLYAPDTVTVDTTWNAPAPSFAGGGLYIKAGLDY